MRYGVDVEQLEETGIVMISVDGVDGGRKYRNDFEQRRSRIRGNINYLRRVEIDSDKTVGDIVYEVSTKIEKCHGPKVQPFFEGGKWRLVYDGFDKNEVLLGVDNLDAFFVLFVGLDEEKIGHYLPYFRNVLGCHTYTAEDAKDVAKVLEQEGGEFDLIIFMDDRRYIDSKYPLDDLEEDWKKVAESVNEFDSENTTNYAIITNDTSTLIRSAENDIFSCDPSINLIELEEVLIPSRYGKDYWTPTNSKTAAA